MMLKSQILRMEQPLLSIEIGVFGLIKITKYIASIEYQKPFIK